MADSSTRIEQVFIHKSDKFHWVGDGFPVVSVFGYSDFNQALSPFLLLDYAPPYVFSSTTERRGVGAHPHRGFETVTIVFHGELEHRDSGGGGGLIGPGDVQWMTAAGGVIHEEFHSQRFGLEGGSFEVAQLWVNLPAKHKNAPPAYQTLLNSIIPRVQVRESHCEVKVIAGEFNGIRGPAKTFTPINLWDLKLEAGSSVVLRLPPDHSRAMFIRSGELEVMNTEVETKDLVLISGPVSEAKVVAESESSLLVMTGAPIAEPVVGYGPFVMNTQAEIKQAYADFEAGKFGKLG